MRPIAPRILILFWLLALAVPAPAHHSVLPFDGTRATTVTGVVTRIAWQNPHTYIFMDVKTDKRDEHWAIESESPRVLRRLGWTKDAIHPGDRISSIGARAKSGAPVMRCKVVELDSHRVLPCFAREKNSDLPGTGSQALVAQAFRPAWFDRLTTP